MDSEHFHPSDDCSTADSVTTLFRADSDSLLLTPNKGEFDDERTTLNVQDPDKFQFSTRHASNSDPLRFERPSFARVAFFTVLCLIAYPALYVVTLVAWGLPLFTVRVIVAVWCSAIGFALGYTLLGIGVRHIEAATWATLIHMSYEESGVKLSDLARNSEDPTSILSALRIFLLRFRSQKAARCSHAYDKRPWSLFIVFFIVLAILSPMLPFLFGRIMTIETYIRNQRMVYREVLVAGDLSQGDVNRATSQFQNFVQMWAMLPYGMNPPDYVELAYGDEPIYFTKPSLSQFIPGGSGLGTFDAHQAASLKDGPNNIKLALLRNGRAPNGIGAVIRYPQWGIRVRCRKLPDPKANLIPLSNQSYTYTFLSQDLLRELFGSYDMDLPASLTRPDLSLLDENDTIPSDIDPSKISYLIKWWQNGITHSFHTRTILDTGLRNQSWTTVETFLIRLDTGLTPASRFPVYANVSDTNGVLARIGYDAVVCVERYEPWIIEAYNTSVGFPAWTILRVVEKGYGNTSLPSGKIRGGPIPNTRYLNTTGKDPAFYVAHDNGINQMVRDNALDAYAPSPFDGSFTDATEPGGYLELSPDRLAVIRGRVGAANILPYLAGSGPVVAQSYPDETLAYVTYAQWQLIGLLVLVLILGITGELFVPTLPHNMPRRGFGMYSWLAFFRSQELQFKFEVAHDLNKMSLKELEKELCDTEVKFVV